MYLSMHKKIPKNLLLLQRTNKSLTYSTRKDSS
jgi:hypothetical protein